MKEKYIVMTGTNVFKVKDGERVMVDKDKKVFITVGLTKPEDLPEGVKVEPLTRQNKYKLKLSKKLKK